jgi:two-component system chemotaxis sensor kinase CheA
MANSTLDPAIVEFIAEGKEILERVSTALQSVERGQLAKDVISALYRDVHTLKGSSQLFGYQNMGQVAHAMEASLDPLRKTDRAMPAALIDACLQNVDILDRMLKAIESGGSDQGFQDEVTKTVARLIDAALLAFDGAVLLSRDSPWDDHRQAARKVQEVQEAAASPAASTMTELVSDVVSDGTTPGVIAPSTAPAQESMIRVHVSLLDRILNLVGELVLVRNQLVQYRSTVEDIDFLAASKSLDVVTSELQGEVMKTRMQPIETVVGKFSRMVRDIAKELGKKIDLTLEGSETELDKSLLEAVKDPLTHIVRNACDHGIETIEERKKAGKPDSGHLMIRSFHEGGQVVIEISDDGRGLNRQKILAKAIEKGLVTADRAAQLADREICDLIFAPGLSTASQVSSVSGRGVGMDVVKTNIERIGGSAEISSVPGKGTTIHLRIPLTLAIVPALVVRSGGEKLAIPQVKLVELVRVGADSNQGDIEYLQGRPMFRLRGSLLPLVDSRQITGEPLSSTIDQGTYIVVLNSEGEHFGLLVPEILDTADIVVKPLSSFLKNLSTFSGATILGDGSIALILDVGGVAQHGKVLNKRAQKDDRELFARNEKKAGMLDVQEFLLFSVGTSSVHAVPLCLVQRLEEFEVDAIEQSGDQRVVRYRDSLLPLINLKKTLNYTQSTDQEPQRVPAIVIQRSSRMFGILVDEIMDVVTIEGQIDDTIRDRAGILGNIIFKEEVVVVIDALGIIERFHSSLNVGARTQLRLATGASTDPLDEIRMRNRELKSRRIRVLYAEDVAFFRRHVSKVLNEAGVDVTTVEDGEKALQELESSQKGQYNLILSDIEMPNMTGLELAREIRKREAFKRLPMIALTTRFREKDMADGRAAGFDLYLEKLNPEKLLEAVATLMGPLQSTTDSNEKQKELR